MDVKPSQQDEKYCSHEMTRTKQGMRDCYISPIFTNDNFSYKTMPYIPRIEIRHEVLLSFTVSQFHDSGAINPRRELITF